MRKYQINKEVKERKEVINIFTNVFKRKFFPAAIIITVMLFFLLGSETVKAYQRSSNFHESMKNSLVDSRKVEIDGKIFDVYINREEKSITVQGDVEDWEEKDKVEKHFRLRSPSDYQLNFNIAIIYR
jgi:hypothetical protein